jgi:hypothetical protein
MLPRWTAEEMKGIRAAALALLEEMPQPAVVDNPPPRRYSPEYEGRAVVSTFAIDDALAGSEEALAELRRDATELRAGFSSTSVWALMPDVRLEVLRQLIAEGRLDDALRAHPREDDALQHALSSASGGVPPLQDLDSASLAALVPILPLFPNLDKREVARRLELVRILEPFRHLVQTFRGREAELRQLRSYVGVSPPASALEALDRGIRNVLNIERRQPCLVVGPGGIGKSTLIAKFLLEHASLAERDRFPFAYIDLDRPVFEVREAATILPEVVRQIGHQFAEAGPAAERLRRTWSGLFESSVRDEASRSERILRDFQSFLDTLTVREQPFLLVLDTFEELQYQSRTLVRRLGELLEELGASIPRLRTVIAGRAEPDDIAFSTVIRMAGLNVEAAVGLLQAKGIEENAARAIAERIGGNPLTLQLAASLYLQEGPFDVDAQRVQLSSLPTNETMVRGVLFRRILAHVHDDDVRRLAHPGLLLRRITPEVIRAVLAEPAGLVVQTDDAARRLFDELRHEVALVTQESDDVLITRPDVRSTVLGFFAAEPERARQVHSRAVAYYSERLDPVSRTEEVYHRLMLAEMAEVLDRRFTEDLIPALSDVMDELPPAAKAYLADRLKRDLPAEAWRATEHVVWERAAVRRVAQRLNGGDVQAALDVLHERPERSRDTPLLLLEAETLIAAGLYEEMQPVIHHGLDGYAKGSAELATMLRYDGALRVWRGDVDGAERSLRTAIAIAKYRGDDLLLLNALLDLASVLRNERDADVQRELQEAVARVPRELLKRDRRFFRSLLSMLPEEYALQLDPEGAGELLAQRRRRSARAGASLHLDAAQRRAAVLFLRSAIPEVETLRSLLEAHLDRSLESLTIDTSLEEMIFRVVSAAEAQDWLGDLLAAARDLDLDDQSLQRFDVIGSGITIEESKSVSFIPAIEIRSYMERSRRALDRIERRMGRLEHRGRLVETVFRLGAETALAARSAESVRSEWTVRFESYRIGDWMSSGSVAEVVNAYSFPVPFTNAVLSLDRGDWSKCKDALLRWLSQSAPPAGECLWLWHDTDGLHVSGVRDVRNVTDHFFTIPAPTPPLAAGALCVDSSWNPIGQLVRGSSGPTSLAVSFSALANALAAS